MFRAEEMKLNSLLTNLVNAAEIVNVENSRKVGCVICHFLSHSFFSLKWWKNNCKAILSKLPTMSLFFCQRVSVCTSQLRAPLVPQLQYIWTHSCMMSPCCIWLQSHCIFSPESQASRRVLCLDMTNQPLVIWTWGIWSVISQCNLLAVDFAPVKQLINFIHWSLTSSLVTDLAVRRNLDELTHTASLFTEQSESTSTVWV